MQKISSGTGSAMPACGSIRLFLASLLTRHAVIGSAGYGTSSSAGSGPGSSHRRAASVARITGMRSCTRIAARHLYSAGGSDPGPCAVQLESGLAVDVLLTAFTCHQLDIDFSAKKLVHLLLMNQAA
jgi:hypothetical protein